MPKGFDCRKIYNLTVFRAIGSYHQSFAISARKFPCVTMAYTVKSNHAGQTETPLVKIQGTCRAALIAHLPTKSFIRIQIPVLGAMISE